MIEGMQRSYGKFDSTCTIFMHHLKHYTSTTEMQLAPGGNDRLLPPPIRVSHGSMNLQLQLVRSSGSYATRYPPAARHVCMHVMAIVTNGLTEQHRLPHFFLCLWNNIDVYISHSAEITQYLGLFTTTNTCLNLPSLRSHGDRSEEVQPEP